MEAKLGGPGPAAGAPGGYAPPWLWVLGLATLPALPGWSDFYLLAGHALGAALAGSGLSPAVRFTILVIIAAEALPTALLAVALLQPLVPGLRRRLLVRRRGLVVPPEIAPWPEIEAWVRGVVPAVGLVRMRSPGAGPPCFSCSDGRWRPQLALADAFATGWVRDRAGAERRIARELARIGQGDSPLLGPGALLDLLLRRWPLVLVLPLLPFTAFWIGAALAGTSPSWLIPLGRVAVAAALWSCAWYAPFIGARWAAELNLERAAPDGSACGPRRWVGEGTGRPAPALFLLLLFPCCYLLRLLLLQAIAPIAGDLPGLGSLGTPFPILREVLFLVPLFGLSLALWPWLGPGWEALHTGAPRRPAPRAESHLAAALVVVSLLALWPTPPRTPKPALDLHRLTHASAEACLPSPRPLETPG